MKTKKTPVFAEEWQLAVLKRLLAEPRLSAEEQRSAALAETGLCVPSTYSNNRHVTSAYRDAAWVKGWFARQKSKAASRNRKKQVKRQEGNVRAHSADPSLPPVATFRLQLVYPPEADKPQYASHGLPSYHTASESIEPARITPRSGGEAQRANGGRRADPPCLSQPASMRAAHGYDQNISNISTPSDDSRGPDTPIELATRIPSYSRDPLYNRYPDFSQFFHPLVHEQYRSSATLPPADGHNLLIRLLANAEMDPHAPPHLRDLFSSFHFDGVEITQGSLAGLQDFPACPISFTTRLGDVEPFESVDQHLLGSQYTQPEKLH
ncbi:hypothetical protein HYDPIDRAFT_41751 [Hydnomerulius pinastri MD-312]|uniref:Uncharacterized protein n=1 Tax=Hydnomerulius pinastri MD-312 TaxID=994086 RepID=A0A0C9WDM1_9AGAM|nr:hypothetical protein HYDPIDRAFT_41751 [Hydnomerulius pinastri MD-312]